MPAGNTYEAIATTTLTTSTNSVSFTSIPAIYTDLLLVMSFTETTAATNTNGYFTFNTDTYSSQTNYSYTRLEGNGSAATSARNSNLGGMFWGYDTNGSVFTITLCNIMNYANTSTNKTILMRQSNASLGTFAQSGLWRNTSAINAINIYGSDQVGVPTADPFSIGSTFALYGIAAA
jgi:hypothetical protein